MFDILVYLFENYFDSGNHPDAATLSRKLSLAGFDDDEISQTLDWLTDLAEQNTGDYPAKLSQSNSFRCYAPIEMEKIDTEGQGFIMFLEQTGILNPLQRELLINQVITMNDRTSSLEKIKLIVLTELWIKNQLTDQTVLEKLLITRDESYPH